MRLTRMLSFAALATALPFVGAMTAPAQISINIGPAPVCPYGYYDYAPYNCAPYGYYGPQWFNGGVFIGAGPWFHGPHGFHGYVNNHYDPHYGYHGGYPGRGEHPTHPMGGNFHGNEYRDGQGHSYGGHYGGHH